MTTETTSIDVLVHVHVQERIHYYQQLMMTSIISCSKDTMASCLDMIDIISQSLPGRKLSTIIAVKSYLEGTFCLRAQIALLKLNNNT
jgi:hypothetical protein